MRSRISWNCVSSLAAMVCLEQQVRVVHGRIHIIKFFSQYEFPCVRYFNFYETKWWVGDEGTLDGRVEVMRSMNLDHLFADLEAYEHGNHTLVRPGHLDAHSEKEWGETPKYLLVNFGDAPYEDAMRNASMAAEKVQADFVVLILGTKTTIMEKFAFWWSHRFPGSPSALIPPGGNSTHPFFFMAVKRSVGRKIMEQMEQDFYLEHSIDGPMIESSFFEFGVDAAERIKGQELTARLLIHMLWIFMLAKFISNGHRDNGNRSGNSTARASYKPAYTGNDLGMGEIQCTSGIQDCPVCLETMQPGETVRLLPCRHILHHDCITGWFQHGKLTCPLCNMDLSAHLEEHRTASLDIIHGSSSTYRWWNWPLRRRIRNLDARDHLIATRRAHGSSRDDENLGDLELTEEAGVFV